MASFSVYGFLLFKLPPEHICITSETLSITSNSDVRSNVLSSNNSGAFFVSDAVIAAVWLLPLLLLSLVVATAAATAGNRLHEKDIRSIILTVLLSC